MSKKRKGNHVKRPTAKKRVDPGEMRVTHVGPKDGSYVRVMVEYRSHAADQGGLARALTDAMYSAARNVDLATLAKQVPEDVVEGEILTPDGTYVVEKWIPAPNELLVLKARPAGLEDLAALPRYGESESETEARKAQARDLIEKAKTAGMNAAEAVREVENAHA